MYAYLLKRSLYLSALFFATLFNTTAIAAISCSTAGTGRCTTARFSATSEHYVRIHINADRPGMYRLYDADTGQTVAQGRYAKGKPAVRRTIKGLYGYYRLTLTGQQRTQVKKTQNRQTQFASACTCQPRSIVQQPSSLRSASSSKTHSLF